MSPRKKVGKWYSKVTRPLTLLVSGISVGRPRFLYGNGNLRFALHSAHLCSHYPDGDVQDLDLLYYNLDKNLQQIRNVVTAFFTLPLALYTRSRCLMDRGTYAVLSCPTSNPYAPDTPLPGVTGRRTRVCVFVLTGGMDTNPGFNCVYASSLLRPHAYRLLNRGHPYRDDQEWMQTRPRQVRRYRSIHSFDSGRPPLEPEI